MEDGSYDSSYFTTDMKLKQVAHRGVRTSALEILLPKSVKQKMLAKSAWYIGQLHNYWVLHESIDATCRIKDREHFLSVYLTFILYFFP